MTKPVNTTTTNYATTGLDCWGLPERSLPPRFESMENVSLGGSSTAESEATSAHERYCKHWIMPAEEPPHWDDDSGSY